MVKRILFISIFREGFGGGEGRVAYEMARWFAKHYDVVMLCPGDVTGLSVDETGFKRYTVRSTDEKNISIPLLTQVNISRIFKFLNTFKPDVVHAHDPALLGVIGQLWAHRNRVPFVYTAHLIPMRVLEFGTSDLIRLPDTHLTDTLIERFLVNFYENCDAVVALNEAVTAEIRAFGYEGDLFSIPNGRNLQRYHSRRFADNNAQMKVLSFIGYLSQRKNQSYLIEVMRHLPANYRLQLIGETLSPAFEKELKDAARPLGPGRVLFTGPVDQNDIPTWLERTHVFVSASKMEVQSLVVIEALASGTPVVGLSNETVDELVDESDGVRLPKNASPADFASAIERLCALPQAEYESLCLNARERVKSLDWSNVMEKTITAYESVIAAHREKYRQPPGHEALEKIVMRIPDRQMRADLLSRIEEVSEKVPSRQDIRPKLLFVAGVTMIASMISYGFTRLLGRFIFRKK